MRLRIADCSDGRTECQRRVETSDVLQSTKLRFHGGAESRMRRTARRDMLWSYGRPWVEDVPEVSHRAPSAGSTDSKTTDRSRPTRKHTVIGGNERLRKHTHGLAFPMLLDCMLYVTACARSWLSRSAPAAREPVMVAPAGRKVGRFYGPLLLYLKANVSSTSLRGIRSKRVMTQATSPAFWYTLPMEEECLYRS